MTAFHSFMEFSYMYCSRQLVTRRASNKQADSVGISPLVEIQVRACVVVVCIKAPTPLCFLKVMRLSFLLCRAVMDAKPDYFLI